MKFRFPLLFFQWYNNFHAHMHPISDYFSASLHYSTCIFFFIRVLVSFVLSFHSNFIEQTIGIKIDIFRLWRNATKITQVDFCVSRVCIPSNLSFINETLCSTLRNYYTYRYCFSIDPRTCTRRHSIFLTLPITPPFLSD